MLESFNTNSEMQYQRLTEEEKQKRGILGRLVGIIADFKNATRNGRKYTEELWDKTFDNPIVKEKISNRCLFGELGHPADRQEIDMEKIAICLAEMPKKGNDGKLYGVFDILDTPNGRILKTMCDYGCNIGVSSRGGGDTFEDYNGEETVEPDTYELECWDAVLLPAVKSARPAYVTESLDTSKKTLKTALLEALEKSTEDEQRVMKTTLDELAIDYSTEEDVTETSESVDNIDVVTESEAAEDTGVDVIKELQEALQGQSILKGQVKSLQQQLSVCYTKESRYSDRLSKLATKIKAQETDYTKLSEELATISSDNTTLRTNVEQLNGQVSLLTESLSSKEKQIEELTAKLNARTLKCESLELKLNKESSHKTKLDESLSSKSAEVKKLTEAYSQLKQSSEKELKSARAQTISLQENNTKLVEELQEAKKDSQITKSQLNAKLEQAKKLVEKYKSVAKIAVDKYISSQATRIGVSSQDITSRLNESYSFKEIDKVVEDLQQYKINLNSLPFTTLSQKKPVKMKITEAKEPLLELKDNPSYKLDDDIDDSLLTFTN